MGALDRSLRDWLRAMRMPTGTTQERATRDKAFKEAFDVMVDATLDEDSWDAEDRRAWEYIKGMEQELGTVK